MLKDSSLSARVLGRIKQQEDALDAKDAVDRRGRVLKTTNLGKSGPKPSMPFRKDLLDLCKSIRAQGKCVAMLHMKEFIRRAHPQWLTDYIAGRVAKKRKERHADALAAMCRSLANDNDLTYRKATKSKISPARLMAIKREFASTFWSKYYSHSPGQFQTSIHPFSYIHCNSMYLC